MSLALTTLAGVTLLVALVSEIFVESVQQAAETFGMTSAFVGVRRGAGADGLCDLRDDAVPHAAAGAVVSASVLACAADPR